MVAEVKSEKTYGDVLNFTTEDVVLSLSVAPSNFTAEITGSVTGLSEVDSEYIKIGVLYSSDTGKVENGKGSEVKVTEISSDHSFSVSLFDLTVDTEYYYCGYVCQSNSYTYGVPAEFTTLKHPYDIPQDLDVASATDLSSSASANCYIVSKTGIYKFKPVKGNSNESVGDVASASMLWETFGTDVMPNEGDLIASTGYQNGYIYFSTAENFNNGNASIAARNSKDVILWSWHIWCSEEGWTDQVYANNAGTMMDRNLGATSATPGNVGAFGLLYQWGRKDPFLGSCSLTEEILAASTGTSYDWSGENGEDYVRRWQDNKKSLYDPCPVGYRVPEGGANGFWATAYETSSDISWDPANNGRHWTLADGETTAWYPAVGYRNNYTGALEEVGYYGYCWSASPYPNSSGSAYNLYFKHSGVYPANRGDHASGYSVRCVKE